MDSADHFDTAPGFSKRKEELEVTGISRSGRVLMKSSKLTDFESPDEIDKYLRKNNKIFASTSTGRQVGRPAARVVKNPPAKMVQFHYSEDEEDDIPSAQEENIPSDSDAEMDNFPHDDDGGDDYDDDDDGGDDDEDDDDDEDASLDSMGSPGDEEDLDEYIEVEQVEGECFQEVIPGSINIDSPIHGSAQSLYLLEKSNKKKLVISDEKIVGRVKAQRKDEGKTRVTAYMLWEKEIRQEVMRTNPHFDFSKTSKTLGELWATVPFDEKYIWTRRAKRLAVASDESSLDKPAGPMIFSAASTSAAAAAGLPQPTAAGGKRMKSGVSVRRRGRRSRAGRTANLVAEPVLGTGPYKVVGTQPIDVAAHFSLLGESLNDLGERLMKHDGPITVNGAMSTLLDTLICVMGPLLCLSQQIPEVRGLPPQLLSKILDNIAYIMPEIY